MYQMYEKNVKADFFLKNKVIEEKYLNKESNQ